MLYRFIGLGPAVHAKVPSSCGIHPVGTTKTPVGPPKVPKLFGGVAPVGATNVPTWTLLSAPTVDTGAGQRRSTSRTCYEKKIHAWKSEAMLDGACYGTEDRHDRQRRCRKRDGVESFTECCRIDGKYMLWCLESTAMHLAYGCDRKNWLHKTGIESQP